MHLTKKHNIVRALILSVVILATAFSIFGSRIFKKEDYIITWNNEATLTFKSWYLLIGLCLFIVHIFFFLREWYHKFKRELMNLIGVVISILLLAYTSTTYFAISNLGKSLLFSEKKLLSIEGPKVSTVDDAFLLDIKIVLLLLIAWSLFSFSFFIIKVFYALRKHKTPVV